MIPESMQQQIYAPPPGPPLQDNHDPELPPPAYDSLSNAATRKASAGPSGYRGPPAVTQPARGGFGGPSLPPDMYPQYASSQYMSPPPPITSQSRNLLDFPGESSDFQNQTQSRSALPSFARPPAQNLYYNNFPPTYLIANGKNLDSGFPMEPPPSPVHPHPFTSHDVNEADWTRFLRDLKQTATLSGRERLTAGGASLVAPSFITGMIVSTVIKKSMEYKKKNTVGELIDNWNHYFFHPRRMEVILAKGQDRVNGSPGGPIPNLDPQIERMAPRLARTSSSSSSSSASSSGYSRRDLRRDKRERKRERKERRREQKQHGKRRGGDEMKYRLFAVAL